ncbi:glycosyltransferase family 4 protein [Rhizobium sp. S152]|uniref:glycosyltransferase family 4 protein n=1 Tax=Rhizobium sp. S152 TaxID=3055038 RepID=UPI0025A94013|nr:glycosyltransferase family 4 protein [Rhizobium sp. S152]MDM9625290.1 glycosyltransferase family 4 protein [Rhizobium sp. S152]
MRIAFYAPLKSPNHTVPSGDRLMGRLLMRALERAGHDVTVVSDFRSFAATPDEAQKRQLESQAEHVRLRAAWNTGPTPQLFFCYHPYYKSPDLFGPALCREFRLPYVTAEASYSAKRDAGAWAPHQALIADAVRQATVNIALTERDRVGLQQAIPDGRFASLKPFIETAEFQHVPQESDPGRLITVAMMRRGDKMDSYAMLAGALRLIRERPWTLTIVGDGPMRQDVERLFDDFEPGKITWLGECGSAEIAQALANAGMYVWPGCGEAYGLAYLEAQATGLPVVAQHTAGVPEVVEDGVTGYLTPDGDIEAYAAAIGTLLANQPLRSDMGKNARRFVLEERSLDIAAARLDEILSTYLDMNV